MTNDTLLIFSDLLEESGKYTQAELIRVGLKLECNLTACERDALQLPTQLSEAARNSFLEQYDVLREQFLSELFCGKYTRPNSVRIDRGIIMTLSWTRSNQELVLPDDLLVRNCLAVSDCNLHELPKGLCAGAIGAGGTLLRSLPDDLGVLNELFLQQTPLTREAALCIPTMKGLSPLAKVTALRSKKYLALADQVERDAGRTDGHSRHTE